MGETAKTLKAKAKTVSQLKNISVQEVMQSYMFERILDRISRSEYSDNFILKGGLLLSSISGIQSRTTMDMDTMLKGLDLEKEKITEIFGDIFSLDANDNITFQILDVEDIRETDTYGGYRFKIVGHLENIKNFLSIDVSTGDIITPIEIDYPYKMIFDDEYLLIKSYNSETLLAEKFQTILENNGSKGRMKDYYDVWFFVNFRWEMIDFSLLNLAVINTFKQRGTATDLGRVNEILNVLSNSSILKKRWIDYSTKHNYTKDIRYKNVLLALLEFSKKIDKST